MEAGAFVTIACTINGEARTIAAPPMKRLLDVLREDLRLTGTKEGCGEGECGSCSVLLNGELVNSCLVPVLQIEGATVRTIEGVATEGRLGTIQRCFLERGGAQCGICTPGMILATQHLLDKTPRPSLGEIQEGLAGNLCRCTGYMRIFEAVQEAVQEAVEQEAAKQAVGRGEGVVEGPARLVGVDGTA